MGILTDAGLEHLLRWGHFLAGVTWIGILYYFNFVQTEWFKEAEANVKSGAICQLVPRALWWFRWGAMFTFLTGIAILGMRHAGNFYILTGALLGTLMFLNVWLIIWPNQKIVIASAQAAASGGQADPNAAAALAKAGLASRTNTLFSIPMLFFMGASAHLPGVGFGLIGPGTSTTALAIVTAIIAALEINAVKGKMGPMASVAGVIHSGIALTIVLYAVIECL